MYIQLTLESVIFIFSTTWSINGAASFQTNNYFNCHFTLAFASLNFCMKTINNILVKR